MSEKAREILANNLRYLLEKKGMSQVEFAKEMNFSTSTLSDWINAKKYPRVDSMQAIAEYFEIGMSDLMDKDLSHYLLYSHPDIIPIETKKIPLIGDIACGEPIYANQDYESYVEVGADVKADFAVRASGDSMLPKIQEGDIVFVTEQPIVEENEVAVVIIEDEVTLKRYRRIKEDMIMLLPDNPEHNAIFVDLKENSNVRILGKAIALQRDIK